mgnify:CR=1 FL=1
MVVPPDPFAGGKPHLLDGDAAGTQTAESVESQETEALAEILADDEVLTGEDFWALVAECIAEHAADHPRAARLDLLRESFEHSCLNRLQLRNTLQMVDLTDPEGSLIRVGDLADRDALEAKIDEMESKKSLLAARQKTAQAGATLDRVSGFDKAGGAMDAFEEMEQKVSGMEDRNRAMQDLRKENDFDAQLKDLGRTQALDDAMAALKAKVQGGGGSSGS